MKQGRTIAKPKIVRGLSTGSTNVNENICHQLCSDIFPLQTPALWVTQKKGRGEECRVTGPSRASSGPSPLAEAHPLQPAPVCLSLCVGDL